MAWKLYSRYHLLEIKKKDRSKATYTYLWAIEAFMTLDTYLNVNYYGYSFTYFVVVQKILFLKYYIIT